MIGIIVHAGNPGVSYQGRIIKPDGSALEGSSVQFRMQVRSPGSENCLLYEEVQVINMAGSSGVFSITLNDGSGTRLDTPTYQVDRIFANRDTMTLDASRCAVGTTYLPNSGDGRKFVVFFKDETMSSYEPLPTMSLNYVPQSMYALEAQKVDKFSVVNILRAVDLSGNPVVAPALDPTQLTNLTNLLLGTSTQYATSTQFSSVQSFAKSAPPSCGIGEVLKSNGTSLSCVVVAASSYSGITAATVDNTIDNSNYAQTWNWSTATTQSPMSLSANALTSGSLMSLTTSSAAVNSTNGLLNVANTSATTTGVLARFQANSTAGSGLTVLANGNVGIGTTSPSGTFQVAGGAASTAVAGSNILLTAQAAGGGNNAGGNINLIAGAKTGTGLDGAVNLQANQVWIKDRSDSGAAMLGIQSRDVTTSQSTIRFSAMRSGGNYVQASDIMGQMMFMNKDWSPSARISGIARGTHTASSSPGELRFDTTPAGVIVSSTRMTIDENGNVGIGIISPGASSILDISSTTKGIVLPRMTKVQRNAIASPVAGMAVYQTDNTPGLRVYNGTNWMRFTETAD